MTTLSGVTRNNTGAPLVSCECFLFKYDGTAHTLTQIGSMVTSDAGTGAYSFTGIADSDPAYMVLAFKNGSPDVFDCTDHNLTPV